MVRTSQRKRPSQKKARKKLKNLRMRNHLKKNLKNLRKKNQPKRKKSLSQKKAKKKRRSKNGKTTEETKTDI